MRQLIEHLREDVWKVTEPEAQALFETSAEVLTGLVKTFEDYEKKGLSMKTAEGGAWATVNKLTGGGKKSGSGRRKN
jgi:hypothetical protein